MNRMPPILSCPLANDVILPPQQFFLIFFMEFPIPPHLSGKACAMKKWFVGMFALGLMLGAGAQEPEAEAGCFHTSCEQYPTFMGGDLTAFRDWVCRNTRYPREAFDRGEQGRILVSFVIDTLGRVTQVEPLHTAVPEQGMQARCVPCEPENDARKEGLAAQWRAGAGDFAPSPLPLPVQPPTPVSSPSHSPVQPLMPSPSPASSPSHSPVPPPSPSPSPSPLSAPSLIPSLAPSLSPSSSPALIREVVRVVRSSPRWTPARMGRECVKVPLKYILPIDFRLNPAPSCRWPSVVPPAAWRPAYTFCPAPQ